MKYYIPICLFLFILSSCYYENNPIGHWHIETYGNHSNSYFTIDFEEDSVIVGNKYSINPYIGKHISENEIDIGVDWDDWDRRSFKYGIKGDKIYLDEYHANRKYIGFRCDSNCCDVKNDFFEIFDIKVKIDLHEIIRKRNELNPINLENRYFANLFIGRLAFPYSNACGVGSDEVLQLNDKISAIDLIPFFVEEKLLKRKKDDIHFRIFTEKTTPISKLEETVSALKKEGIENIWLVCANPDKNVLFEYVHSGSLGSTKEGLLEDILN